MLGLRRRQVITLDGGVSGWNRQPQHIGEASAVAVSHCAREGTDLGCQNWQRRHHRLKTAQPTLVIRGRSTFKDETVNELTCEPNPHSGTWNGICVLSLCDAIVERAIKMRQ